MIDCIIVLLVPFSSHRFVLSRSTSTEESVVLLIMHMKYSSE